MNTFDEKWEEVHRNKKWGMYPAEETIRFIARNYYNSDRKNIKILDMGCGAGANTWYISREGFDTYAFDGSLSAVKKTISYLNTENLKAEIIQCDAADTQYEDEFFNSIIDGAVIYANTLKGIKSILKEMNRILKRGGKIFSTGLFNQKTTGYGTGECLEKNTYRNLACGPLKNIGTFHFFSEEEIKFLWEEAGFKNIKIDSITRTDNNKESTISFYIVEAEK